MSQLPRRESRMQHYGWSAFEFVVAIATVLFVRMLFTWSFEYGRLKHLGVPNPAAVAWNERNLRGNAGFRWVELHSPMLSREFQGYQFFRWLNQPSGDRPTRMVRAFVAKDGHETAIRPWGIKLMSESGVRIASVDDAETVRRIISELTPLNEFWEVRPWSDALHARQEGGPVWRIALRTYGAKTLYLPLTTDADGTVVEMEGEFLVPKETP